MSEQPSPSTKSDAPHERFKREAEARQSGSDEPELDLWTGSYSSLDMVGSWALAGVATLVALVVGLLYNLSLNGWGILLGLILLAWIALSALYAYRRWSVHYTLTSQRFIHAKGLLWRKIDRIELIDIDDVVYAQGPVQRVLGVGAVHVSSSDRTTPELTLPGIADVATISDLIDDARRKERRSRGLHIEAV